MKIKKIIKMEEKRDTKELKDTGKITNKTNSVKLKSKL